MERQKQYTVTLKGKVQEIGFRGYAEDLGRRLGIGGIIYNISTDEAKVLCEGDARAVRKFYSLIQQYRLAEIRDAKLEEGVQLPYPIYRAVAGLEQELYSRLDQGVRLLEGIKEDTASLEGVSGQLTDIAKDLSEMKQNTSRTAKGISEMRKDMNRGLSETTAYLKKIADKV